MKWETVKDKVAREVYTAIIEGRDWNTMSIILMDLVGSSFEIHKGKTQHEVVKAYADKAWDIIQAWDVRCVSSLRELFPRCFPASLRTGGLVCYMADNENSDWMVERRTT